MGDGFIGNGRALGKVLAVLALGGKGCDRIRDSEESVYICIILKESHEAQ